MHRSPTRPPHAYWSDPFRILLTCSLLALVGWIVVQSGDQEAAASRIGPGDEDVVEVAPIVVSFDEVSPFGMPIDGAEPDASVATATPDHNRTTAPRRRATTSTRGPARTPRPPRPPSTGGGTTSPPPSTGGGTNPAPTTTGPTGPGNGPAAQSPVTVPGNSGTSGGPGVPATPVQPTAPGGGLPAVPGASTGNGQGPIKDLVGDPLAAPRLL